MGYIHGEQSVTASDLLHQTSKPLVSARPLLQAKEILGQRDGVSWQSHPYQATLESLFLPGHYFKQKRFWDSGMGCLGNHTPTRQLWKVYTRLSMLYTLQWVYLEGSAYLSKYSDWLWHTCFEHHSQSGERTRDECNPLTASSCTLHC